MESNKEQQQQSSPCSLGREGHKYNYTPHSPWLHSTLLDLDNKMKTIHDQLIEDDGDTFAKRAEMYFQKRPQLIKNVQEILLSIKALSSSFNSPTKVLKPQIQDSGKDSNVDDRYNPESSSVEKSIDGCSTSASCTESQYMNNIGGDSRRQKDLLVRKKVEWNEDMRILKLVEEYLHELIKRNDEKNKLISELRNENEFLKSSGSSNTGSSSKTSGNQNGALAKSKRKLSGFLCFR